MESQSLKGRVLLVMGFVMSVFVGLSFSQISIKFKSVMNSDQKFVFDKYIKYGIPIKAGDTGPSEAVVGVYNRSTGQYCTGLTIKPRVVVTASHCVYDRSGDSDIEIRYGMDIFHPVAIRLAKTVVTHEKSAVYRIINGNVTTIGPEEGHHPYDVALVQIDGKLPRDFAMMTAIFDKSAYPNLGIDNDYMIYGYGATGISSRDYDGRLRVAYAPLAHYNPLGIFELSRAIMVGGSGMPCPGDSGGPLFATYNDGGEKKMALLGIFHSGDGDCDAADYVAGATAFELLKRHPEL